MNPSWHVVWAMEQLTWKAQPHVLILEFLHRVSAISKSAMPLCKCKEVNTLKIASRASLVAQWLRIRLPMQGTRVWALVREYPTCLRATKPVRRNYWACTLEPVSHNYWAHVPQLLKPVRLEPVLRNKRSHCNERPIHRSEEWALLAATGESLCTATKTQCSQN